MGFSAVRVGINEILRVTGTSKTWVWRWQPRVMESDAECLLIDKTRPSRIPPLDVERAVALTLTNTTGHIVPVRLIAEQHIIEDLGRIPSFVDWVRCIRPEPWMSGRDADR